MLKSIKCLKTYSILCSIVRHIILGPRNVIVNGKHSLRDDASILLQKFVFKSNNNNNKYFYQKNENKSNKLKRKYITHLINHFHVYPDRAKTKSDFKVS